jgi:hypothetical protein
MAEDGVEITRKEGCLDKISRLDQELSSKIHEASFYLIFELIILVFAALFNRAIALSSFLISFFYVYTYR